MEHIETIELGSSQSSITLSSIPQDYNDLVVIISARSQTGSNYQNMWIKFNGSTTGYSEVLLFGNGSSASSGSISQPALTFQYANVTGTPTFGSTSVYISNYKLAQAKSVSTDSVTENNANAAAQAITAGLWNDTNPITSIEINAQDGIVFLTGTTASLFGVTAGGDGTVTTS